MGVPKPTGLSLAIVRFTFAVAFALLLGSGCSKSTSTQSEADKLKEKKPQRPFETLRVFTEPNERSSFDEQAKETGRITLATKPGHWTGVLVQGQANLYDFDGVLEVTPRNAQQRPVDLERSPFWITIHRPATLPKGQRKLFETVFFAPRPAPDSPTKGSTWISTRLARRGRGQEVERVPEMVAHMPVYQYFWVVLAQQPGKYGFLKDLPSVRPPLDFMPVNVIDGNYYRVLYPPVDQPLALAHSALCWTTIAHLLWDDVLPGTFSPEQQQALIDWLHWGGSLVISGPDSLDKLRGSFLEPYLPVRSEEDAAIDPLALAELHAAWNVPGDRSPMLGSGPRGEWSGVKFRLRDSAEFVPGTANLIATQRVGRGRVVVSAFRLSEPELVAWPSYDSFVNGCLLGRPARLYDPQGNSFKFVGEGASDKLDPHLMTGVRLLTRDEAAPPREPLPDESIADATQAFDQPSMAFELEGIDALKSQPGAAAWDDFSWISSAARQTLQSAAGISVPKRQFVLKMIGLYLLIIVPLNWLLFRLIGRVELAWAAVPLVAVVWGLLVVWLAQLDIGFARSQMEVDVVELQPDYPRAHLTRYVALYSSLSSEYALDLNDASALALPFSTDRQRLSGQGSSEVLLGVSGQRELSDYPVASNSTGMVHVEQWKDLEGSLSWMERESGGGRVRNGTNLEIAGAVVLRRRAAGEAEIGWVGELTPDAEVDVTFGMTLEQLAARRDMADISNHSAVPGSLNLRKLIDCVQTIELLRPDEVRLVGWRVGAMDGLEVSPSTAQVRGVTLVVAHLQYGEPSIPARDMNLRPLNRFQFEVPDDQTP